jgi:hypothetical protein
MLSQPKFHNSGCGWRGCRITYLVAFLVFATCSSVPARAEEALLGWLLYASNDGKPGSELPADLSNYNQRLPKAFGYSSLRVIGEGRTTVGPQGQRFLIFTGDLKIMLTNLTREKDGRYLIGLQLFQGDEPVLEAQAQMTRGSPLFIRAPTWRQGQLILAVMVTS